MSKLSFLDNPIREEHTTELLSRRLKTTLDKYSHAHKNRITLDNKKIQHLINQVLNYHKKYITQNWFWGFGFNQYCDGFDKKSNNDVESLLKIKRNSQQAVRFNEKGFHITFFKLEDSCIKFHFLYLDVLEGNLRIELPSRKIELKRIERFYLKHRPIAGNQNSLRKVCFIIVKGLDKDLSFEPYSDYEADYYNEVFSELLTEPVKSGNITRLVAKSLNRDSRKFNLFIDNGAKTYNLFGIERENLDTIINAYDTGKDSFFINGKNHLLGEVNEIQIFKFANDTFSSGEDYFRFCSAQGWSKTNFGSQYIPSSKLEIHGDKLTEEFIKGEYGHRKEDITIENLATRAPSTNIEQKYSNGDFIDSKRIKELESLSNNDFDLLKLIQICKETNSNYKIENYLSVAMLSRTILNHTPPIFGLTKFKEVASNYGGAKDKVSFKRNMQKLLSAVDIADKHLHDTIRKSESLPNKTQVDFSQNIDVLLEEICKILK